MRKLTRQEFAEEVITQHDMLKGVTEEEVDTMFYFFNLGRQAIIQQILPLVME